VQGSELPSAGGAASGRGQEGLVLNVYVLESKIEAAMHEARAPGLAISIVHGEAMIYARGFGVTSVEEGAEPVTPRTVFRIGSLTKPLTGTAVMRLVDAGKIELDRPVQQYLPWFTVSDPAASEQITLRMLLTHTSGLPHDHKPFGRRDPIALEERVRHEVPRYPLVAAPSTTYSYSNTGIHVVAHVAEVLTGTLYPQLLQSCR
jgi:CubicO group peptidase (beta-lactamase class C family)